MKRNRKRYALAALLAFVVATASFAFAAANTVNTSYAGNGDGDVSGFVVTPDWDLVDANPGVGPTADLTLDVAADEVFARALDTAAAPLSGAAGNWVTCTGSGTAWSCTFGSTNVEDIERLEVAASS
jgi:hypothetical protein